VVGLVAQQTPQELLERQTLVGALGALEITALVQTWLAEQAVQALSFSATPAQFNISLVAQ
jgi:hypothetical protein